MIYLTDTHVAVPRFQALLQVINGPNNPMELYDDFLHFTCKQKGSKGLSGLPNILGLVHVSGLGSPIPLALLPAHALPPVSKGVEGIRGGH